MRNTLLFAAVLLELDGNLTPAGRNVPQNALKPVGAGIALAIAETHTYFLPTRSTCPVISTTALEYQETERR
jgi:hypothetical protein